MNSHGSAIASAATTGVLVGAAMVSTRAVAPDTAPATLALLRYLIGVAVLALPVWLGPRVRFARRDALAIAVLGVFQFAVLIVLLNFALQSLPAATCSLVFSTMPLFTLCLGAATGRERFGVAKLGGLVLAIAGVFVLLRDAGGLSLGSANAGTDALRGTGGSAGLALASLFAATIVGAVCSLLYRPYLQRYPTLPTSALAMAASVLFLAMLCVTTGAPLWPPLSATQWANVGFIGLSSGLGYFCWLWALAKIDASRVAAFQALGPVTAAAIEQAIARAWPSAVLLSSIALVVAGLLLAQLGGPRRALR